MSLCGKQSKESQRRIHNNERNRQNVIQTHPRRDNKKRLKRAMIARIRGRRGASGMHICCWRENKLVPTL